MGHAGFCPSTVLYMEPLGWGGLRILGLGSSAVQVMIQFEDILEQRSA